MNYNTLNWIMIISWSIAYGGIIYFGFKYPAYKHGMYIGLLAGMLDITWEICAGILSNWYPGHVIWFSMDCVIFGLSLYFLYKKHPIYSVLYFLATVLLFVVMHHSFFAFHHENDGYYQATASFLIDIVVTLEFLALFPILSKKGKLFIGGFRFMGDLFAWLADRSFTPLIDKAGIFVVCVDAVFVTLCIIEKLRPELLKNAKNKLFPPKPQDKKRAWR